MKGPALKLLVVVTVCLAIAAGCAAPAAAPEPPTATPIPPTPLAPEGMDVVRAWADALYSGDVDAALSYFTDDGSYVLFYQAHGKEELRWAFNSMAGLETKYADFECQPEGDKLACAYTGLDGCMAASGAAGLPLKATFIFQDGKIKEVTGYDVPGPEWDSYWKYVEMQGAWQSVNRPAESAKAIEGTREGGAVQVGLCRDYAAALKTQPAATEAAVQAWVAAINSGDVDAALALFKGEAMFTFWKYTSYGEEQMRAMFDWLAGKETLYQIANCEWQDTGVECDVTAVDGCIDASGVPDGLHGKLTFVSYEDGKLKSVSGVLVVAERNAYQTWLDAERTWAAAERADELAQAEDYSKPSGALAVKLCREYAAAQK